MSSTAVAPRRGKRCPKSLTSLSPLSASSLPMLSARRQGRPEHLLGALAFLLCAALAGFSAGCSQGRDSGAKGRVVKVWVLDKPTSADPYDFDQLTHHLAFGSVFAGLVSQYRLGEHTGVLAKSWRVSRDQTEWTFLLRKDIAFANGDRITPKEVFRSWLRIARQVRARGSGSRLFARLAGWETFTPVSSAIPGITYDADSIRLRFKDPFPTLLDVISFGRYAVVHPSQYAEDGSWLPKSKIVASGPYSVDRWDDRHLELRLRDDFPQELRHPRPLRRLRLVWDSRERPSSDLLYGSSLRTELADKGYEFHGGFPSQVVFVKCMSWQDPSGPCHGKSQRALMRDVFYAAFEKAGYRDPHPGSGEPRRLKVVRSLFPLAIKGVSEFASSPVTEKRLETFSRGPIRYWDFFSRASAETKRTRGVYEYYFRMARWLGTEAIPVTLGFSELAERGPDGGRPAVDLAQMMLSTLVPVPDADIRFFLTTDKPFRLPDATGEISKHLKQPRLDVQAINALLWDQAIIWPLFHYAPGLWARENVDFSMINLVLPPTAFQWLGWKE